MDDNYKFDNIFVILKKIAYNYVLKTCDKFKIKTRLIVWSKFVLFNINIWLPTIIISIDLVYLKRKYIISF
jgi:hypothetical protein